MFSFFKKPTPNPIPNGTTVGTVVGATDGVVTGVLLAMGGAVLFSGKAILVKLIYRLDPTLAATVAADGVPTITAITIMGFRMAFALPCYLLVALWFARRGGFAKGFKRKYLLPTMGLGLLGYYASQWLDLSGLMYIDAGLERLILFIYPTLVVVILAIYERKALDRPVLIALMATYVGVAVAFGGSIGILPTGGSMPAGDVAAAGGAAAADKAVWLGSTLVFVAALSFALFNIGAGAILKKVASVPFTTISMATAAVASLLHYVQVYGETLPQLGAAWGPFLMLTAIMALFCTVLPSFMIAAGIARIGAGPSAIIGSVGPVATLVLAALLLDEVLGLPQLVGAILVIGGVLTVGRSQKKKL